MAIAEEELKAASLPIKSFDVKNFRVFDQLSIPTLARVNLITGKNNVGKSTLLEAIYLYCRKGSPTAVRELVQSYNTYLQPEITFKNYNDKVMCQLRSLIYNCNDDSETLRPIVLGDESHRLRIETQIFESLPEKTLSYDYVVSINDLPIAKTSLNRVFVGIGQLSVLDADVRRVAEAELLRCEHVSSCGLTSSKMEQLWDLIVATDLEDNVIQSLQMVLPSIERFVLIGKSGSHTKTERVPMVKMSNSQRVPLKSLGNGINRIFSITLAMVNCSNGVLLIDEIENGLHYSVLPSLWRLIFETAKRLNIQVFATTHSWECIESFNIALKENESEGELIRLTSKGDNINVIVLDEHDLDIITSDLIEVR